MSNIESTVLRKIAEDQLELCHQEWRKLSQKEKEMYLAVVSDIILDMTKGLLTAPAREVVERIIKAAGAPPRDKDLNILFSLFPLVSRLKLGFRNGVK